MLLPCTSTPRWTALHMWVCFCPGPTTYTISALNGPLLPRPAALSTFPATTVPRDKLFLVFRSITLDLCQYQYDVEGSPSSVSSSVSPDFHKIAGIDYRTRSIESWRAFSLGLRSRRSSGDDMGEIQKRSRRGRNSVATSDSEGCPRRLNSATR